MQCIGGRRHRRVSWSTGASAEAREPCQVKGIAAACVQWADDSGLSVSRVFTGQQLYRTGDAGVDQLCQEDYGDGVPMEWSRHAMLRGRPEIWTRRIWLYSTE